MGRSSGLPVGMAHARVAAGCGGERRRMGGLRPVVHEWRERRAWSGRILRELESRAVRDDIPAGVVRRKPPRQGDAAVIVEEGRRMVRQLVPMAIGHYAQFFAEVEQPSERGASLILRSFDRGPGGRLGREDDA